MESFIKGLKKLEGYKGQIEHIEFLPRKKEVQGTLETPLSPSLQQYLDNRDITLYKHQADAINLARKGENIVITTPTASGKTLAFNIPVFEALSMDPQARALYIYPMKALTNDQQNVLLIMEKETGISVHPKIYDGDTSRDDKRRIRDKARIVLTNPYGLHHYLHWHHLWKNFYENLQFIIIDESHTYRGVFGSHIALLIRRIQRICRFYGSNPQYILSSATIANPKEHSKKLTGKDFHVISSDSSESGKKSFIFWNPPFIDDDLTRRSTHQETRTLLSYCIREELQTLCFTKSRKMAELIGIWVKQDLDRTHPELADAVYSYRAGYHPEERRKIERGLKQREISGVVTTNALELGIDIGSLDCVIMSGYPGTVISTWQQAGRAGRLIDDSVVFLVAFQDPLDQYFMNHPQDFFSRNPENAVINLDNPYITIGHVMCASNELPLSDRDIDYFSEGYLQSIDELSEKRLIKKRQEGWMYSGTFRPETRVKLNNILDQTVTVFHYSRALETMDITQAYREVHEGAIFLHQGEPYQVNSLDLNSLVARVEEADPGYYTEALKTIDISIKSRINELNRGIKSGLGKVDVTEYYIEYRRMRNEKVISKHPLNLPPLNFPSIGFWFTIPSSIVSRIRSSGLDLAGGLHAIEHAMIAISPLHAMCDPRDLGGVSTELHRDTMEPTIFVYDGYKGGIGLSEKLHELLPELLGTILNLVKDCKCEEGCPSCIYSSKCGTNNEPLDKKTAIVLLNYLVEELHG
ncbi:MAG: DEAD/DEAH box helicase [Candidatus Bathyarchaeota archaeon]|jgi:DEAD/DEAH box helicase domain-containing protein|nr:DEAD/DEAH box helicase [Candidatus Bathyarchaeota archaeon]